MNHLIDIREGVTELSLDTPEFTEAVQAQVDTLEQKIMGLPPADCPVVHRFTPGLYIREILMPKGTLITSANIDRMVASPAFNGTTSSAGPGAAHNNLQPTRYLWCLVKE